MDEMPHYEWEEIYRRYVNTVYRLCFMYLRNVEDTEDAVQSIFFKLISREKSFSDYEHVKSWLIVATRNHCKDILKSWWRSRRVRLETLPELKFRVAVETTSNVLDNLLLLPEKYKTVLYLYYYEDFNVREIATMLGRKESTIQTHLATGRKRLKLNLEDQYATLPNK
ncbi:RNA polymerase sigma-70 factor (ECF subfamily) [Paenibacillus cellulosilyticus]|uniref:RNA polymerase sigma-70 factor (ECF subfamily) n=1 Tax=Paenibacillus cellulosilyticus TaxID=375489 RepID=A0A2V2YSX0_9BACL|nr:RNA polymerase sigma factor [Paenibacillus cellulosilyticus]PWW02432.1 RNA polymerase sigma-70 factor (ECF subfamily) [Paenibacillus cellulosilyticus]QKS47143.1 RNA polymerase sigma factor [Paenibacillus cellulosilyticus]